MENYLDMTDVLADTLSPNHRFPNRLVSSRQGDIPLDGIEDLAYRARVEIKTPIRIYMAGDYIIPRPGRTMYKLDDSELNMLDRFSDWFYTTELCLRQRLGLL